MNTLGLTQHETSIPLRMITTAENLLGYETTLSLGIVEGIAEVGFTEIDLRSVGMISGGKLDVLVTQAKNALAYAAFGMGANAVVGFGMVVAGRKLEKSVIAFGTAVKCRKVAP